MIILCELSGDPDLAHSSFFFTLDMSETGDKKLKLNCPWDFDRCFGSCDGLRDATYSGLWCAGVSYNPWVALLSNASWNFLLAKTRWEEIIQEGFATKCLNFLDLAASYYEKDFAKNSELYPVNYKYNNQYDTKIKDMANMSDKYYKNLSTEKEAKELLKSWLDDRLEAMHSLCRSSIWLYTYANNNKTINNILATGDWLTVSIREREPEPIVK